MTTRQRFTGCIVGLGSTSGVRVVVGHWTSSPLGTFTDVMLASSSGERLLLAPSEAVADFVSTTYRFDRVVLGPVTATVGSGHWQVGAPDLDVSFSVGRRTALGVLLRVVPRRLATAPAWSTLTDPVARRVLRGVRTKGTAGNGRTEYYGATDLHRITGLQGTWQGVSLGALAPVAPEPGFGFSSTPRRPGVTSVVTTIDLPD